MRRNGSDAQSSLLAHVQEHQDAFSLRFILKRCSGQPLNAANPCGTSPGTHRIAASPLPPCPLHPHPHPSRSSAAPQEPPAAPQAPPGAPQAPPGAPQLLIQPSPTPAAPSLRATERRAGSPQGSPQGSQLPVTGGGGSVPPGAASPAAGRGGAAAAAGGGFGSSAPPPRAPLPPARRRLPRAAAAASKMPGQRRGGCRSPLVRHSGTGRGAPGTWGGLAHRERGAGLLGRGPRGSGGGPRWRLLLRSAPPPPDPSGAGAAPCAHPGSFRFRVCMGGSLWVLPPPLPPHPGFFPFLFSEPGGVPVKSPAAARCLSPRRGSGEEGGGRKLQWKLHELERRGGAWAPSRVGSPPGFAEASGVSAGRGALGFLIPFSAVNRVGGNRLQNWGGKKCFPGKPAGKRGRGEEEEEEEGEGNGSGRSGCGAPGRWCRCRSGALGVAGALRALRAGAVPCGASCGSGGKAAHAQRGRKVALPVL